MEMEAEPELCKTLDNADAVFELSLSQAKQIKPIVMMTLCPYTFRTAKVPRRNIFRRRLQGLTVLT